MVETLKTREAAHYLGLSTVALLSKKNLLDAKRDARGWLWWPVDRLDAYGAAVAGKSLNDPTRGEELAE